MSREIDKRIAFEVMGWVRWTGPAGHKCHGLPHEGGHRDIPEYSTDPAAAMEVVERMKVLGFSLDADNFTGTKENPWSVRFGQVAGCWDYDGSEEADTFCKAVCLSALAALRAVGGEGGRKDG